MDGLTYIFSAPGKYIQGKGAVNKLGGYIKPLGGRVLVIGGKRGLDETRKGRTESFLKNGIRQFEEVFQGEVSDAEIARLVKVGKSVGCDIIMASGGGKVIDAAKAVSDALEIAAVIVPTIASNDAPCSALSVIYNDDGTFSRLMPLRHSPALVLVDTEIITMAPARQLASGIGDALTTWFEAEACHKSGALNHFGGSISMTALALARLCYDTLMKFGREAMQSCEQNEVTYELNRTVEATVLLSGLGFESGGVAVAHAISESFSKIPAMHGATHGEKAAFGLLAHLLLDDCPEDTFGEVLDFCIDIGLPVTLAELGYSEPDEAELRAATDDAAKPGSPAHNLRAGITGAELYDAVIRADAIARARKNDR